MDIPYKHNGVVSWRAKNESAVLGLKAREKVKNKLKRKMEMKMLGWEAMGIEDFSLSALIFMFLKIFKIKH